MTLVTLRPTGLTGPAAGSQLPRVPSDLGNALLLAAPALLTRKITPLHVMVAYCTVAVLVLLSACLAGIWRDVTAPRGRAPAAR